MNNRMVDSRRFYEEGQQEMKRTFSASVWREGDWCIAQCLEVDVASQGESEEALENLREAMELHFEPPVPTDASRMRTIEVEVGAAYTAAVP